MISFQLTNIFLRTYYNPDPSTALLTKHLVPIYSNSVSLFSDTATLLTPIRYNPLDFLHFSYSLCVLCYSDSPELRHQLYVFKPWYYFVVCSSNINLNLYLSISTSLHLNLLKALPTS